MIDRLLALYTGKYYSKPAFLYLPFLFLYILLILVVQKTELTVDEPSYLGYVQNLLKGYYSISGGNADIWHGPGYPLLLTPFVAIGFNVMLLRLLNAVMLYLCLVFFHKTLDGSVSRNKTVIFTLLLGCYWLAYKNLAVIMTETLCMFLFSLIIFFAKKWFSSESGSWKKALPLALCLAYLALVKILFGYVIVALIVLSLLMYGLKKNQVWKKVLLSFCLAFVGTLPYLGYTYSITGKVFYWSNAGGLSLYWMSTPYADEWGDWHNSTLDPFYGLEGNTDGAKEHLIRNHAADYLKVARMTNNERDAALKQMAIENIKQHPKKFMINWLANVGRLFFNYPYSYRKSGIITYLNMLPNMFLLVISLVLWLAAKRYRLRLPAYIYVLLWWILVYTLASTLLSSYIRFFYILAPVILCWQALTLEMLLKALRQKQVLTE